MKRTLIHTVHTAGLLSLFPLSAADESEELDPSVVVAEPDLTDPQLYLLRAGKIDSRRTVGVSFQELLGTVPGVHSGNPTAGVLSIRGVNQDGLFGGVGAQTNPLVTIFEDGVPLSTNTLRYLSPPAFGLNSMQVRRGPQNFLASSASIAGSLHLNSALPKFDFSGKAVLEYSEHGTLSTYFSQNIPLIADELSLRLSYYGYQTDGEARAPFQGDSEFGAWDRDRFKGQLLWHPGKNNDNSILLTFLHDEAGGNPQANTLIAPGGFDLFDRTSTTNTPSSYPVERQMLSLQASFNLGNDLTFRSTTAYQRIDLGQNLDFDGTPLLAWTINGQQDERLFTQALSLSGENNAWKWETGAFYENSKYEVAYGGIGIAPFPAGSPYQNRATTDVETFALYGKFSRELSHDLRLVGGLRYQHDSRELNGSSVFSFFPTTFSRGRASDDVLLPSLRLEWAPDEETAVALGVDRGYRAGGIAFAPVAGIAASYDAEYSWDVELSARHAVSDTLEFSGSLFYSWMDDQQVSQTVPGGLGGIDLLTTNAGKSHRYGMELEARWKPAEGLKFFANAAYTKTEFDELVLGGMNRSGQAFPNAPEWTFSCGADYRHSSGFFANINYSWADDSHSPSSAPSVTRLENRSLLNARIGYSWENVTCYVFGSNLLDDEYALYRGVATPPVIPQVGKAAPSRMVGVGVELTW